MKKKSKISSIKHSTCINCHNRFSLDDMHSNGIYCKNCHKAIISIKNNWDALVKALL